MSHSHDDSEMDDIGCLQAIEQFYDYLNGEIADPEVLADFEHHLGHCRSCFSRLELERALTDRIERAADEHAPEAVKDRLRGLLDKL